MRLPEERKDVAKASRGGRLTRAAVSKMLALLDRAIAPRNDDVELKIEKGRRLSAQRLLAAESAENERLREERDLAVAHDRQPYPTAWAYDQACKALNAQRKRAEKAEGEVEQLRAELRTRREADPEEKTCGTCGHWLYIHRDDVGCVACMCDAATDPVELDAPATDAVTQETVESGAESDADGSHSSATGAETNGPEIGDLEPVTGMRPEGMPEALHEAFHSGAYAHWSEVHNEDGDWRGCCHRAGLAAALAKLTPAGFGYRANGPHVYGISEEQARFYPESWADGYRLERRQLWGGAWERVVGDGSEEAGDG